MRLAKFGGRVHLMSPLGGAEHTLCGVASDAADSERDEGLRFSSVAGKKIDCAECIQVIDACFEIDYPTMVKSWRDRRDNLMHKLRRRT